MEPGNSGAAGVQRGFATKKHPPAPLCLACKSMESSPRKKKKKKKTRHTRDALSNQNVVCVAWASQRSVTVFLVAFRLLQ